MRTALYAWILTKVLPFLRFSTQYTRFSGKSFVEGYTKLKRGQILLTVDESKATSFLIPGLMSHAAFVVNVCNAGNQKYEVAEMTHLNFTKSYFFDVCKEASRVIILECTDWRTYEIDKMIEYIPNFYKCKYDIRFTLGVRSLYCSELIYQLDNAVNRFKNQLKLDLSDLAGIGQPYISPDGLLFAQNVRVVWDSDGVFDGLTGPQAEKKCRQLGIID